MDQYLSWIFFGMLMGGILEFVEFTPKRQHVISSIILGVGGAALGGLFSEMFFSKTQITDFRFSPLLAVLIVSFFLVVIPKNFFWKSL